jgi:hypothetical protein
LPLPSTACTAHSCGPASGRSAARRAISQTGDQIERFALGIAQRQRLPADPHNEVPRTGARRIETGAQLPGPGVAAVGNQHLAGHRLAAQQRLRAVPIGQLQVAEAATTQVVHPVQAPVGACAAGLAQAAAIGDAQAAPRPQQRSARRLSRQQPMRDGGQECHRAVQPLVQRLAGEFGHAVQTRPDRGVLEAFAGGPRARLNRNRLAPSLTPLSR